jgi:hypothetical protein
MVERETGSYAPSTKACVPTARESNATWRNWLSDKDIRVANLAASHALVFEQPHAIADEMLTFLR